MTAAEHPPGSPAGLSVVLVDDEADVLTYLAAVLERHMHSAHVAETASTGFDLIKRVRPDVACIDIVMPERSGVTLYRQIRDDPEVGDTPVVFISALKPETAHLASVFEQEEIPAPEAFVEKPPKPEAFINAVETAARTGESRS